MNTTVGRGTLHFVGMVATTVDTSALLAFDQYLTLRNNISVFCSLGKLDELL